MLVYKITNTINGKLYFGITKCSIKKRWNEHVHNSLNAKKKSYLNRAIKKYGVVNFTIGIIKVCVNEQEMYESEKYFIALYKSNNRLFGYNNSIGGEISSLGKTLSESAKIKISEYQRTRERQPHSDATKDKMRIRAIGRDTEKAYKKSAEMRKGKPANNRTCVKQFSLDGQFIKKYDSITDAAQGVNGVPSAFCAIRIGRLKTYKGFIWKHEN